MLVKNKPQEFYSRVWVQSMRKQSGVDMTLLSHQISYTSSNYKSVKRCSQGSNVFHTNPVLCLCITFLANFLWIVDVLNLLSNSWVEIFIMSNLSNINSKIYSVQIHVFEVSKVVTFHKSMRCVQSRFLKGVLHKHFDLFIYFLVHTKTIFLYEISSPKCWLAIIMFIITHTCTHIRGKDILITYCVDGKKQKSYKTIEWGAC